MLFLFRAGLTQDSEFIQSLLDMGEEDHTEIENWIENLWELTQNPINLNTATIQELLQIPFINPDLARKIVLHRSQITHYSSISELSHVPGFSDEIYEAIQPMVTVKRSRISPGIVYRFQTRFENPHRKGYDLNEYNNPLYLQHRILFQVNSNIRGGIIWEKDAGEENMFDYGSFYLLYRHPTNRFLILAGDYYKKVGLGLILWTPYGRPLSLQSLPSYQSLGSYSRGNQSTREVGFMRGISVEYQILPALRFDLFFSANHMDASISDDGHSLQRIDYSGLHRTDTEKKKLRKLKTSSWGICLNTQFSAFAMQISGILNRFQPGLQIQQSDLHYISHAYQLQFGSLRPAGEIALFSGRYPAFQQHIYYSEGPIQLEVSGFYYHRNYLAQFGRGFGSFQTPASNRLGSATILLYQFIPTLQIGAHLYIHKKIFDSRDNLFVSRDYAIELRYKGKKQRLRILWKMKIRMVNLDQNSQEKNIHSCRMEHVFEPTKRIKLRHRLESRWSQSHLSFPKGTAISLYQHIDWRIRSWYFSFRWTTFEVPDYDLRIYEYETDLPGNFRSILLNGRGYKFFAILRWLPFKNYRIDLKYSQRLYPDQNSVGSGLDEIPSNKIHEFRLSIVLKY
jgi:hypothetical protein